MRFQAQGYLDCQNILSTLGNRNKHRLEAACQEALNIGAHPTYSTLKRLMAAIDSDAHAPRPRRAAASTRKNDPAAHATNAASQPDASGALVRGADYYRTGR